MILTFGDQHFSMHKLTITLANGQEVSIREHTPWESNIANQLYITSDETLVVLPHATNAIIIEPTGTVVLKEAQPTA